MIAAFQSATPLEDYILEATMTNGNCLTVHMLPYLYTVQFYPLKDIRVWKSIQVQDNFLRWNGTAEVELSIDTLLGLFKAGGSIAEASVEAGYRLRIKLTNGNAMLQDLALLLDLPMFAPLAQKGLWKTMQADKRSLLWENKDIRMELPIDTLLNYFA